jgi:XTP/dITP diphosphohydrolase
VGFDWENATGAWEKLKEEILEFEEEPQADTQKRTNEMGDIFFALINYCRLSGIDADEALTRTNQKFKYRFEFIEKQAEATQRTLSDLSLAEMEAYWQAAKTE